MNKKNQRLTPTINNGFDRTIATSSMIAFHASSSLTTSSHFPLFYATNVGRSQIGVYLTSPINNNNNIFSGITCNPSFYMANPKIEQPKGMKLKLATVPTGRQKPTKNSRRSAAPKMMMARYFATGLLLRPKKDPRPIRRCGKKLIDYIRTVCNNCIRTPEASGKEKRDIAFLRNITKKNGQTQNITDMCCRLRGCTEDEIKPLCCSRAQ